MTCHISFYSSHRDFINKNVTAVDAGLCKQLLISVDREGGGRRVTESSSKEPSSLRDLGDICLGILAHKLCQ
jgi:hypothetical protein